MREWMETHHPRLIGAWDWPAYRLLGRCWAQGCGRPMVLHSPWRLFVCERTPLAIALTDQGRARIAADGHDLDDHTLDQPQPAAAALVL
jgi:hypothetical protein